MLAKSDFGLDPTDPGNSSPGPVKQAPEDANGAGLPASTPGHAQETGGFHADCSQAGARGEHGIPCLLHSMRSALHEPCFAWLCLSTHSAQPAGRGPCQARSEVAHHAAGERCEQLHSSVKEAPEMPGNQHATGNACVDPTGQRRRRSTQAGDAARMPSLRCCSLLHSLQCTSRLALRHYPHLAVHVSWRGV